MNDKHIMDEVTENYKLNKLIVLCLTTVVILVMIVDVVLSNLRSPALTSNNPVILAFCTGLLGFMSRGVRLSGPAGKTNTINTDSVDTVVVQPQNQDQKDTKDN